MTNRELIKQLLDEDLDAEVVIEVPGSAYFNGGVTIQGIQNTAGDTRIFLVPDADLVNSNEVEIP